MTPTKRFSIGKMKEGGPWETEEFGTIPAGTVYEPVEEYDDEYTARVRLAILSHGLPEPQQQYMLEEQVEEGVWEEVEPLDDDDDDDIFGLASAAGRVAEGYEGLPPRVERGGDGAVWWLPHRNTSSPQVIFATCPPAPAPEQKNP